MDCLKSYYWPILYGCDYFICFPKLVFNPYAAWPLQGFKKVSLTDTHSYREVRWPLNKKFPYLVYKKSLIIACMWHIFYHIQRYFLLLNSYRFYLTNDFSVHVAIIVSSIFYKCKQVKFCATCCKKHVSTCSLYMSDAKLFHAVFAVF
jgi:hypothetical protein